MDQELVGVVLAIIASIAYVGRRNLLEAAEDGLEFGDFSSDSSD